MRAEQQTPETFDLRVHIKDPKTGELVKLQNYKMICSKTDGTLFERPIGSGHMYDGAGKLVREGKGPKEEKLPQQARLDMEKENHSLKNENEILKQKIAALDSQKSPQPQKETLKS